MTGRWTGRPKLLLLISSFCVITPHLQSPGKELFLYIHARLSGLTIPLQLYLGWDDRRGGTSAGLSSGLRDPELGAAVCAGCGA